MPLPQNQNRAGASVASPGGGGADDEAGRHGNNDNDVDESDISAIVSRANFLVQTDCQVCACCARSIRRAWGGEGTRRKRGPILSANAESEYHLEWDL